MVRVIDKATRSAWRSAVVARGQTSLTDDDQTVEECLRLCLDALDDVGNGVWICRRCGQTYPGHVATCPEMTEEAGV